MGQYIFRWSANVPQLSYAGLRRYLDEKDAGRREIGSTVEVRAIPGAVIFRLYELDLAIISGAPMHVKFTQADDPREATKHWLSRIVQDNDLGHGVSRVRRRKSDGPGPRHGHGEAGVLVIDGNRDKPVIGQTYSIVPWIPPMSVVGGMMSIPVPS